eukprot:TRINITY_DN199_c0_g3_i1.p1 TRINITY_DN199_c0_g3~~TRINITY_DN199_c0_g3_i1.p1  ORF type:complete len:914 (+),score=234.39 TRINITY_DN199_c0_g3_i1:183-2924(+)
MGKLRGYLVTNVGAGGVAAAAFKGNDEEELEPAAFKLKWFKLRHGNHRLCVFDHATQESGGTMVADFNLKECTLSSVDYSLSVDGIAYSVFLKVDTPQEAFPHFFIGGPVEQDASLWLVALGIIKKEEGSEGGSEGGSNLQRAGGDSVHSLTRMKAKQEWAKLKSALYIPPDSKRGWVKVRGGFKQWSLRLVVLAPPTLLFFRDEAELSKETAVAIINLKGCTAKARASKKEGFCFKIERQGHNIWRQKGVHGERIASSVIGVGVGVGVDHCILRATNKEEGLSWLKELETVIADITEQTGLSSSTSSTRSLTPVPASPLNRGRSQSGVLPGSSQLAKAAMPAVVVGDSSSSSSTDSDSNSEDEEVPAAVRQAKPSAPAPQPPVPQAARAPKDAQPSDLQPAADAQQHKEEEQHEKKPSAEAAAAVANTRVPDAEYPLEPSHYVPEIPRPEMQVDQLEEGMGILLGIARQLRPGMDLSRVTLPTHILEPRSFLEKTTDYFAHLELLSQAANTTDPLERMIQLVKWSLSGFYIKPKFLKKPYNPIRGETSRCMWVMNEVTQSKSFLICEQVSHHPPVSTFYACNRTDGWVINGHIIFKSKFWGTSAGSVQEGFASVHLLNYGEEYRLNFPSVVVKGLIVGPLTMELYGNCSLCCQQSPYRADIDLKLKPMWGGDFNVVSGKIKKGDELLATVSGKFDKELFLTRGKSKELVSLWKVTPELLHDRIPRLVIPMDEQGEFESERLWHDVTIAIIDGDQEAATVGKTKLEDAQRVDHKARELSNELWVPKFFHYDESKQQWFYNWFNPKLLDRATEVVEYESDGRILAALKQHAAAAPSTATLAAPVTSTAVPAAAATATAAPTTAVTQVAASAEAAPAAAPAEDKEAEQQPAASSPQQGSPRWFGFLGFGRSRGQT